MSTTTWIVIAIVVGILIIIGVIAESARKKTRKC